MVINNMSTYIHKYKANAYCAIGEHGRFEPGEIMTCAQVPIATLRQMAKDGQLTFVGRFQVKDDGTLVDAPEEPEVAAEPQAEPQADRPAQTDKKK